MVSHDPTMVGSQVSGATSPASQVPWLRDWLAGSRGTEGIKWKQLG